MWVIRFGDQRYTVTGDNSCKIGRCRTTNDIVVEGMCVPRRYIELCISASSCNPENLTVCCKKTVQDNEQNTQSRLTYSNNHFKTTFLESNTHYDISPDVGEIHINVHPQCHSTITVCYDIDSILQTLFEPTQAELYPHILTTEPLTDEALWQFLDNPQPEKRPLENTEAPHDDDHPEEEEVQTKPVRKRGRRNTQMWFLRSGANRDRKAKTVAKRLINRN